MPKVYRVAVLALNSDRYFEALFAIPAAGAIIVPINTRLAAAEIAYILEDGGAKMLFLDDAFIDLAGQFASVTDLIYLGERSVPTGMRRYASLLAPEPARCSFNIGGDDVAGIFYTGGTTGRWKGVMLSHGNLVSNAASVVPAMGYDIGSIYAHAGPMFHLADGMSTFAVTMVGGTHVFIPRFNTADVLAEIARNQVTHTLLVPTMISAIVNFPDLPQYDLSSFGCCYGASPVP